MFIEHSELTISKRQKRKRTLDYVEGGLEPYRKKPRVQSFTYENTSFDDQPINLSDLKKMDVAWMISTSMYESTPMWVGWNSRLTSDRLPKQKVFYMENICLPPTRNDVVLDTMKKSQQVAVEINQDYVIVHYDLAIAKNARAIQEVERPRFNNIFICFGGFHIQMAYFKALGYMVSDSGGPEVLIQSGVLGKGSLNGFVGGKHFNQFKRIHPLLANAIGQLHLQRFVEDLNVPLTNDVMNNLKNINKDQPSQEDIQKALNDPFIHEYMAYKEKTRAGEHGDTARFWMQYADCVDDYKMFSRACRTNDVDLFIYSLGQMIPMYFAAGQPNYSRWMVCLVLDLLNAPSAVKDMLAEGALSVRRSSQTFARYPVDLTLEQTVNADAASRKTGITAFSTSESARKRWMVTRTARSAVIGNLLKMTGMKQSDDTRKEWKHARIARDHKDIKVVMMR